MNRVVLFNIVWMLLNNLFVVCMTRNRDNTRSINQYPLVV